MDPNNPSHIRRSSSWRVLINTNVSAKGESPAFIRAVLKRLNDTFEMVFGPTPTEGMNVLKDLTPERVPFFANPEGNEYIEWKKPSDTRFPAPKYTNSKKAEIGNKFHKIHLHGEFRIVHYGAVRLRYENLQGALRELVQGNPGDDNLHLPKPFIKFSLFRDETGYELYIGKGGEIDRIQSDLEVGPTVNIEEEEAEAIRLGSNESSNSRRRHDIIEEEDLIPAPLSPEVEEELDPRVVTRRLRPRPGQRPDQAPEFGGVVYPRSEIRTRRKK